jgi:hypothetical protein
VSAVEDQVKTWLDAAEAFEAMTDTELLADLDSCPQGCGRTTEDPYGGPCRACWNAVPMPGWESRG